jgi:hypothetical protein
MSLIFIGAREFSAGSCEEAQCGLCFRKQILESRTLFRGQGRFCKELTAMGGDPALALDHEMADPVICQGLISHDRLADFAAKFQHGGSFVGGAMRERKLAARIAEGMLS